MWQESADENGSNRSETPPLPIRAPAPPPPAFVRSHSLGKNESKLSYSSSHDDFEDQQPPVPLNLLGRHTHHYPAAAKEKREQLDYTKVDYEELESRCAQMEKTMRWWSECTANWRDKWSKVRAERNKFKDELKRLTIKYEATLQDLNRQQEVQDLPDGLTHKIRNYYPGGIQTKSCRTQEVQTINQSKSDMGINTDTLDLSVTSHNMDFDLLPTRLQDDDSGVFQVKESNFSPTSDGRMSRFLHDVSSLQSAEQSSMLQFRLDEALKTITAERNDKELLQKEIESLNVQITSLDTKCDELTLARTDLTKDMSLLKVDFTDQIRQYARQMDDNVSVKHNLEQVISHLREEIERLQAENAEEWGRRERLETDKLAVDRQNKKLKTHNEELKNRVERLTTHNSHQTSTEIAKLQGEAEKIKLELSEMKHLNGKLKKSLSDKNEELHHWQRKGDNSEKEIRSLRLRIEQLKQELGDAQDDIDSTNTTIRRLDRTNEELSSQCEGLQVQVEHLTSRLRSMPSDLSPFRRISRVSAPGGMMSASNSGFGILHDLEMEDTSTDENEFSFNTGDEHDEETIINETDV